MPMTVMPTMATVPPHLGCHPGILLNRHGGAGIGQRHRLGALGWSGQNQQSADCGKSQKSRHVHIYLPWSHLVSRRDADREIKVNDVNVR